MVGLIVLLGLVVLIAALMWWAVDLPPTRPRPDSRFRGATYMSVHRRLRAATSAQRAAPRSRPPAPLRDSSPTATDPDAPAAAVPGTPPHRPQGRRVRRNRANP